MPLPSSCANWAIASWRNLSDSAGELDLLVLDGQTIVVVEVRSSENANFQQLAATVDHVKQRRITDAALRFFSAGNC